jgi:hypothetical protein
MSDFFDLIGNEKTALSWIEQGTMEWDQIRVGRFTASEIWKLIVEPKSKEDKASGKLSETAMTYIQDKVAEIMTGQSKQQGYAFPLVWGTEKEPEAREKFIEVTGLSVERVGFFPYTDHAGGSPDGIVEDSAILEIKCPYDSKVMIDYLMLTDVFDLKRDFREYYWQCQANMLFSDKKEAYFVAYDPRMIKPENQIKILKFQASESDQDLIIAKIAAAVKEKLQLLNLLQ